MSALNRMDPAAEARMAFGVGGPLLVAVRAS